MLNNDSRLSIRFAIRAATVGAAALALSGCSGLIKSSVDTQPRVQLSDADYRDPAHIVRGDPMAFVPSATNTELDVDLVRFAPILVQGFQPAATKAKYDRDDDAIGTPMLTRDGKAIRIDTARPAMFCRVEHAEVHGVALKQLAYVFWYPRRPVGAIETGEVDGGVLRITLDAAGQPAILEYSQACGCYHGVFVSNAVESAAVAEYAEVARDRVHVIEPPLNGLDDWVVRGLVHVADDSRTNNAHPIMYISAGKHFCEALAFAPIDTWAGSDQSRDCALLSYEMLDAIEQDGGDTRGSMFNDAGLVIGGKRWKEEVMLGDLQNAGWPRRLDVMRLNWDKEEWTDPHLIEQHLRVPAAMLHENQAHRMTALPEKVVKPAHVRGDGHADMRLESKPGTHGTLLVFTNRSCLGCMEMKRSVLPDDRVQRRLRDWTLREFDTATPQGAALAAVWHVSATPVLIVLDPNQHEVSRSEDLLTVAEMLEAVPD